MKHNRLIPVWALALALGLSFATLSLTACNAGGGDDSSQAREAQKETDATDDEGKAAADGQADQAASQDEAVWVLTREVETYRTEELDSDVELLYELDDQGNAVKVTQTLSQGDEPYVATNTFDEDGYIVRTDDNLEGQASLTYTLEKDEQGRMTKCTGSDGTVEEITYDDAGNIAKRVMSGNTMGEDPDGNWTVTGTYSVTTTYDADGRVVSVLNENAGYYQLVEKTYEFNDVGQIASVTSVKSGGSDPDNLEADTAAATTATVEYDENGNVSRVTEEGDLYTYIVTYEYALIEHPSLAVRQNARTLYL